MFESLTHWFDSLGKESKLFNNPQEEVLQSALASVLYHLISVDQQVGNREKQKFDTILKQQFDLSDQQISHLYQAAKSSTSDLHTDLQTVNHYLKQTPALRMNFMDKLNQLIDINGVQDSELDIFYEALHLVFPELKRL
ncbi:MAG: TerB family tellurite resistance protein [Gammaproteobacteria bacterium]|nr:TerB family tellurite resistance protein [Gammaproteobacteria bacterium]